MKNLHFTKAAALIKNLLQKPELVFSIIALVFGLIFIFSLAPLSGTDEFTHFPHLYQISQGTMWEQPLPDKQLGGELPTNINNMVNDYRNLSRFPTGSSFLIGKAQLNAEYSHISNPGNKKVPAIFTSTVIYPPWAYFPSLIGLEIAKVLHLPLIWFVYLARLSNFLVWLVLAYAAIKLLPAGKWFLTVLALTPTALSQAATIGGDGIQMVLSWLLIAMVLAAITGKVKADWKLLLLMLVVAIYASIIKDGYFLIGLLPLAIPMDRFNSRPIAYVFKTLDILLIAVSAILLTLRTVHAVNGIVLTPTIGMNFNSHDQIHYMIYHFFTYAWHVIEEPFTKVFDTTYLGIVGIVTNRLIYLSILVIGIIYACLVATYKSTDRLVAIAKRSKLLMPFFLGIFFLTYCLLASAFYIGNTSVGAEFVNGFYGRYFLPIIPLLLIIPLSLQHRTFNKIKSLPVVITGSGIGLLAMVLSLQ